MTNLGDLIRPVVRWLDGLYIKAFGRRVHDIKQGFGFRGLFELPYSTGYQTFGIDSPDEIAIECSEQDVLKRYGRYPEIGSIFWVEGQKFQLVCRHRTDSRLLGTGRLVLTAAMYAESVTSTQHTEKKLELTAAGEASA